MMRNRFSKIPVYIAVAALAIFVFGFVTMHLWNWLMPPLFGLRAITYLQALGLILLGKILFGGFHRHGGPGRRGWKRHMHERWEKMTPEEREKFRAGMRDRWGCRPARPEPTPTDQPAL